jgi:formamidopyrimidine-DNA glycosylase
MPELPEVETVRRSLETRLPGRRIERVHVHDSRLRYPVRVALLQSRTQGRRVCGLDRRSKYLLIHLEGDSSLIVHLGMSGRLLLMDAGAELRTHDHVCFDLDDGQQLRFNDPRRFGLVDVVDSSRLEQHARIRDLGVEPLSADCTADLLGGLAKGKTQPVKNFIMDARRVVGVGNIYANEALHLAGVHPQRAAGRLSRASWERLTAAIKKVLGEAIEQGGTTLNDFQNAAGEDGYFQVYLRVYQREGEPCVDCKRTVKRKVLAGRSTFYCPSCQR